jgi:penicillin-binding protein 1A
MIDYWWRSSRRTEEENVAATVLRERPVPPPPRGPKRHPVLRRVAGGLVALVVVAGLLLGAGWALTPSVADASDRVAAQLAAHSAAALQGPVPAKVAAALIATEDSRFENTPGVDPLGLLREPLGGVTGRDEGGATLEQQLAKNLYERGDGVLAKAEGVVLALKLDRSWTKAAILRMYLDDGYYGSGYYGLAEASTGYFGVPPGRLTWAQASLLAGLFQAPSAYDPVAHPAAAKARQQHVLDRLVATGRLSRSAADAIAREDWGLRSRG